MKHQPVPTKIIPHRYNLANLILLRDHLAWLNEEDSKPKIGFNMNVYYAHKINDRSGHKCSTVACIAGHAVLLSGEIIPRGHISNFNYFEKARTWLRLSLQEAHRLFHREFYTTNVKTVELKTVISVLDHMIEYQEVPRFMFRQIIA